MYRHFIITGLAIAGLTNGIEQAAAKSWYASGQLGVRAVERQEISGEGLDIGFEQHNGLYASAAIGKIFDENGIGLRGEIETAWRDGGRVRQFSVNGAPANVDGQGLSAFSVMANGIIDLNNASRLTPYVGAGMGLVALDGDINAGENLIDDRATAFGVQAIAGLNVRITRSVSGFTDFRYQKAVSPTMTLTGSSGSGDVDVDYDAYTVGFGFRVRF